MDTILRIFRIPIPSNTHSEDTLTGLGTCVAPILRIAVAAGSPSSPTVTCTPGNSLAASTGEIQHSLGMGGREQDTVVLVNNPLLSFTRWVSL